MKEILARVNMEGPIRARDLDSGNKGNQEKKSKGNWWNWGASKRALDKLFMQGNLMVCERNGMEKVYDLTERCLPKGINMSMPTLNEYASYLFDTTLRSHGVFTLKQLLHLKTGKPIRETMGKILDEHIDAGVVKTVGNANTPTAYVDIKALEQTAKIKANSVRILSPFDNALIHRHRLSTLFNFDYRIECYTPVAKRVFGYFCLPILYGDKFIGRVDCKAHRAERRFEVLSLNLEGDAFDRDQFFPELNSELQRLADFNMCSLLDASLIVTEFG